VDQKTFTEPRLALNRIYTKQGDGGETSLAGGQKVAKDDLRIESYGTVDELNAVLALARVSCQESGDAKLAGLGAILRRVRRTCIPGRLA
jgi:cob(I)alamin adenosyltransferase